MHNPGAPRVALVCGCLCGVAALALLVDLHQQVKSLTVRTRELAERTQVLGERADDAVEQLRIVAGEVTRFRLEQSVDGKGPAALLEVLRVYAPLVASSRVAQPDYKAAREQIDAVLRAFRSVGADAYPQVLRRFDELKPKESFDELRWLLEALVACDPKQGERVVEEVLAGTRKPQPRLRWIAADLLTRVDKPAAQAALRRILLTESRRGIDPNRAVAQNLPLLDPAAVAVTGFHNFVVHYLATDDPQTNDTLVQVLQRSDQDSVTLKETIEALGERREVRADKRIEDLYRHPPDATLDPLFMNKCLDALASIRGAEGVRPFLEEQLIAVQDETVLSHLKYLLAKKDVAAAVPVQPAQPPAQPPQRNK
jgi:HEAT repeat protein